MTTADWSLTAHMDAWLDRTGQQADRALLLAYLAAVPTAPDKLGWPDMLAIARRMLADGLLRVTP